MVYVDPNLTLGPGTNTNSRLIVDGHAWVYAKSWLGDGHGCASSTPDVGCASLAAISDDDDGGGGGDSGSGPATCPSRSTVLRTTPTAIISNMIMTFVGESVLRKVERKKVLEYKG